MIMTITDWHYNDFKNEETFLQFSQRGWRWLSKWWWIWEWKSFYVSYDDDDNDGSDQGQ